jgi:hypothetical protein
MSCPTVAAGGSKSHLQSIENSLRAVNERPGLWLTLLALLLAAQIRPWWFPQGDGMSFLSMARSFAVDGQMRNLGSEHFWFFPGYSLLLSPLYLFGERPFWLLSAFQWASAILFMIGVYWWARSVVPRWAVWIAAISVINQGVWIHCARTMSEVPFMCGLIWSVNAARAAERSRSWRQAVPFGLLAAALLTMTSLIRPAGILLAVGYGLGLGWKAWQKNMSWRRAAALTLVLGIPGSLAILGCIAWDSAAAAREHGRTYLHNFGESAANPFGSYVEGARLAIRDSGRVIIPGMFKAYQERGWRDLNLLVYLPACGLLAWGWRRLLRSTIDPLLLMTPFYVLLYVVYPYEAGARFYIPLLPVFAASFVCLILSLPARRHLIVASVLGAHLALAAGYWLGADSTRGRIATARWGEIDTIGQSIVCQPDRVVACDVSGDDMFMLSLVIDRRVPFANPDSIAADVEWVVTKRNALAIYHFERCTETDSLCLLRRCRERDSSRFLAELNFVPAVRHDQFAKAPTVPRHAVWDERAPASASIRILAQ